MDNQECRYSDSLLRTSQCLAIAQGALEFACKAIEIGNPSAFHVEHIRKDIARIKELMG